MYSQKRNDSLKIYNDKYCYIILLYFQLEMYASIIMEKKLFYLLVKFDKTFCFELLRIKRNY